MFHLRRFHSLPTLLLMLVVTPFLGATVTNLQSQNVPSTTYEASTTNNIVLHLVLTDDGSGDTLQSMALLNADTHSFPYKAKEADDIASVKLWWDADGDPSAGMISIGTFIVDSVVNTQWALTTSTAVSSGHLFVTVDTQGPVSLTGTRYVKMRVPASGAVFQNAGATFPSAALTNLSTLYLTPQTPPVLYNVSLTDTLPATILSGPATLDLARFDFQSDPATGHENDAGIYVNGFWVTFLDGAASVDPSSVFNSISVLSWDPDPLNRFPYLDFNQGDASYISNPIRRNGNSLYVDLTQNFGVGPSFVPGSPASILFQGELIPGTSLSSLQLAVSLSGDFTGVDSYTGRTVPAAAIPGFPLLSNTAVFQQPATQVTAAFLSDGAPTEVVKGSTGNTAFRIALSNQGSDSTGQAQVNSLYFDLGDENDNPVVPRSALSSIRVDDGVNIYCQRPIDEASGNRVVCALSPPINLRAGNPLTVQVKYGVKADALPQALRFHVNDVGPSASPDWQIVQAGTSTPVSTVGNTPFPTPSVPVTLVVGLLALHTSTAPPMVFLGQTSVPWMDLQLTHPGPAAVGAVVIDSITFHVSGQSGNPIDAAQAFSSLRAASTPVISQTLAFSGSQATLTFPAGITLSSTAPGQTVTLSILGDLTEGYSGSGLRLSLDSSSDILSHQSGDPLRVVRIAPSAGDGFPMAVGPVPVAGGTLDQSFSNFPNPFHAGRETTQLAYRLSLEATVTLRLFTLTGKPVRALLNRVSRPAGLNLESWDGRNESGQIVLNGIYLAVLETAIGGKKETVKRFVAVSK